MPGTRVNRTLAVTAALSAAFLLWSAPACADAAADTSAGSAVVIEQSSRRVLYEKNAHEQRPMASTTKIMTALVALEYGYLDDVVTVSENASGVEGSSLYLGVGEKLTLRDLLYGLMLRSGNDAAVAIAEHIGGSVPHFVEMMNEKAKELGAYDTNFVTPNGLDADGHVTTAYDLALIAAAAMENETFAQIVSTQRYVIPWEGHEWDRVVVNKNKLLTEYDADGIKTGYTKQAGRCLVGAKTQDGMQLVSVVLNCAPMFEDTQALMDTCFAQYEMTSIASRGQEMSFTGVDGGVFSYVGIDAAADIKVPLTAQERDILSYEIDAPTRLTAPVEKGQKVGSVTVRLGDGGEELLKVPLCAQWEVPRRTVIWGFQNIVKRFLHQEWEKESDFKNILPAAALPPGENASN